MIEDAGAMDSALDEAFASHAAYRGRQEAYVEDAFGPADGPTAPIGADAIMEFLLGGRSRAQLNEREALVPAE